MDRSPDSPRPALRVPIALTVIVGLLTSFIGFLSAGGGWAV
jgi:hypothetical protein